MSVKVGFYLALKHVIEGQVCFDNINKSLEGNRGRLHSAKKKQAYRGQLDTGNENMSITF